MATVEERLAKVERDLEVIKRDKLAANSKLGWLEKVRGTLVFLFDTNHISVWQRGEGAQYERLCSHLEKYNGDQIYVCIVSFHELVNGWNTFSAKKRNSDSLVCTYFEFEKILRDFSLMQMLSFDRKAG